MGTPFWGCAQGKPPERTGGGGGVRGGVPQKMVSWLVAWIELTYPLAFVGKWENGFPEHLQTNPSHSVRGKLSVTHESNNPKVPGGSEFPIPRTYKKGPGSPCIMPGTHRCYSSTGMCQRGRQEWYPAVQLPPPLQTKLKYSTLTKKNTPIPRLDVLQISRRNHGAPYCKYPHAFG